MWLLLCGAAWAHPYDTLYFGHLLQLRIDDDRVLVGYTLEVPAGNVRHERKAWAKAGREAEAWLPAKTNEIVAGLDLRVDGRSVPYEAEIVSATEDTRFVEVQIVLEAPLSPGAHEVELGDANYPEEQAFFRGEAWVARPWAVTATSLVEAPPGRAERSYQGKWRADEGGRRLAVTVAPRTGLDRVAMRFEAGDGWRPVDEALRASPLAVLESGWLPLVIGGAALAAGWWWTRRERP